MTRLTAWITSRTPVPRPPADPPYGTLWHALIPLDRPSVGTRVLSVVVRHTTHESREDAALWHYNRARVHRDRLWPVLRLPPGVAWREITCHYTEPSRAAVELIDQGGYR